MTESGGGITPATKGDGLRIGSGDIWIWIRLEQGAKQVFRFVCRPWPGNFGSGGRGRRKCGREGWKWESETGGSGKNKH